MSNILFTSTDVFSLLIYLRVLAPAILRYTLYTYTFAYFDPRDTSVPFPVLDA